jgi:hypothetical protein
LKKNKERQSEKKVEVGTNDSEKMLHDLILNVHYVIEKFVVFFMGILPGKFHS